MAVIAHHPVIIHFKGVAVGFGAVDVNIVSAFFQLVVFIQFDGAFVNQVIGRDATNLSPIEYLIWIKLYLDMAKYQQFDIAIDKLTRSIENAVSGDSFKTEVVEITPEDLRKFKKEDWLFDWKAEMKVPDKTVYKLVIVDNTAIIQ